MLAIDKCSGEEKLRKNTEVLLQEFNFKRGEDIWPKTCSGEVSRRKQPSTGMGKRKEPRGRRRPGLRKAGKALRPQRTRRRAPGKEDMELVKSQTVPGLRATGGVSLISTENHWRIF